MDKVIRYRLYPDRKQAAGILATVSCCRFVYNQALTFRKLAHDADGTHLTYEDTSFALTRMKRLPAYAWLKDADSAALQQALRHLDAAFAAFFRKNAKFPKYKSKHHSRLSYTTPNNNGSIAVLCDRIRLPKLGTVKAVIHRAPSPDWRLTSCTVVMERDGSLFASCHFDTGEDPQSRSSITDAGFSSTSTDQMDIMGLDYRSDGLYMDSEGHVCGMPKFYRKNQEKLKHLQRKLRNKTKGSGNYRKAVKRISRLSRHISDMRKDFLHKESRRIANSRDIVCVEDLDMKGIGNHGLGKATMDNGYGMFLCFLEYKLREEGKALIKVSRWYPSTQTCHVCGGKRKMGLSERVYVCSHCGMSMDRDENAAINIRAEGIRMMKESGLAS